MKRHYILISIGIFILLGIGYLKQTNRLANPSVSPTPTSIQITQSAITVQITDQTIKETNDQKKYSIDAVYPEFVNLSDSSRQKAINDALKQMVEKEIDKFRDESSRNTTPAQLKDAQAQLIITYETAQANDSFISLYFKIMDGQIGAAHPYNYNLVFNYDVKNGKLLDLNDLFQTDSNFVQKLSDLAKKDLLAQQKDNPNAADFINEGTEPKEENFKLFTLTANALELIFNPATVAPDYAGTMKVMIPYQEITDIRK